MSRRQFHTGSMIGDFCVAFNTKQNLHLFKGEERKRMVRLMHDCWDSFRQQKQQ